jgi:hypothetical protein
MLQKELNNTADISLETSDLEAGVAFGTGILN